MFVRAIRAHGALSPRGARLILGLDHVGIVVRDLKIVGRDLSRIFGVPPEPVCLPEVGLTTLNFKAGNVGIELLRFDRPIPGIDPRVFEAAPGIQHLAFRVRDLEQALHRLWSLGVRPLAGFPRPGVHGTIAFFRDPITGALLEFVEV